MPSEETLRKEEEIAARFAAEDAAQGRLGFSLQRGKGRKNGSRARAEARQQQQVTDSYAEPAAPKRVKRPLGANVAPAPLGKGRGKSSVPPRKSLPWGNARAGS
jgi:hypothetical protein